MKNCKSSPIRNPLTELVLKDVVKKKASIYKSEFKADKKSNKINSNEESRGSRNAGREALC